MTNHHMPTANTDSPSNTFGARLKSAREAMGLDRKDAAAQLRLSEKIIVMLEMEQYAADLPITFIRGYLRSYGKLLHIPELEITKALEPIKPKTTELNPDLRTASLPTEQVTTNNYFMQLFTYFIVLTLIGLMGRWWYNHGTTTPVAVAENKLLVLPETADSKQMVAMETPTPNPTNQPSLPLPTAPQNSSAAPTVANPQAEAPKQDTISAVNPPAANATQTTQHASASHPSRKPVYNSDEDDDDGYTD